MSPGGRSSGPGVYLHVPFCRHRCGYCAFATWTDRDHLQGRYVAACHHELAAAPAWARDAATAFVGGGTPTRLAPDQVAGLVAALPVRRGGEVTVEANPDDVTTDLIDQLAAAGATRISLGVQSFDPVVLASLDRTHEPAAVDRAVNAVHGRDLGLSLDLIMGAAGESPASWAATVAGAVALEPDHISAYGLIVEPGTPLHAQSDRHPDDDDQADKYLVADEALEAAGYGWYEISNWARPGHQSLHNACYWDQGDYLAVGCAAHGHRHGHRWWNLRTPERYITAVEAGTGTIAGDEHLDAATSRREADQLALRTRVGVAADAFAPDVLDDLVTDGLLDVVTETDAGGRRAVLTPQGRLLANGVALSLESWADTPVDIG